MVFLVSVAVSALVPARLDSPVFAVNTALIDTVKGGIDKLYAGNDLTRFWCLETVA